MQESSHHQTRITRYRTSILAAVVLALTTLSFHGGLDNFAHERVDETTTESIGIYALSRGTNAAISVFQTSQVKVPFLASIQVGELLDPVNDAIERLSSAMVWAIGSLFLQRIVLEVAASSVFKWSFFAAGLMAILALLLVDWERFRSLSCRIFAVSEANLDRYRDLLVRIFIVAVIFRFIVPAFVAVSFLVSQMLLETEINEQRKNLSLLSAQVSVDTTMGSLDDQRLGEQRAERKSELDDLRDSKESLLQELEALDQEIEKLNDKAGVGRWVPKILGGAPPEEKLVSAKARREEIGRGMERIEQRIDDGEEDLECIEKRLAGESCDSWLDKLSSASKAGYTPIKEIVDKSSEMFIGIAKLLIAVIVKNIILPIVFLMIAVKCSVPIAKYSVRLSSILKQDSKGLRDALQQAG